MLGRLQTLAALEAVSADELVLVLDGRPLPDVPEGRYDGVQVLYARRGGRDAADDRIVEEVAAGSDAGSDLVVTSDRELRRRVVELGAGVEGASALLGRLDAVEG